MTFTNSETTKSLVEIKGEWLPNTRPNSTGGAGHTLEEVLGIAENNLPVADTALAEIKTQYASSSTRVTLGGKEPSPKENSVTTALVEPLGWPSREAGGKYPTDEKSLYLTVNAKRHNQRGFGLAVDHEKEKIDLLWNTQKVNKKNSVWLENATRHPDIDPERGLKVTPYWRFKDVESLIKEKIKDCVLGLYEKKIENGVEYVRFTKFTLLKGCTLPSFLSCLESGLIVAEFRARTGHNHGTVFRVNRKRMPELYRTQIEIA